jgi:thioredoxin-like negative regulator of GroEL
MKASSVVLALCFLTPLGADDALEKAKQLEKSGDVAGARMALSAAAQRAPSDVDSLKEYADFLNRYGDSEARGAYSKAFEAAEKGVVEPSGVEASTGPE